MHSAVHRFEAVATALIRAIALLVWALLPAWALAAPAPVVLDGKAGRVDAWPAVTFLMEGGKPLTASEALARLEEFVQPVGPHANMGRNVPDVTWLHISVQNAAQDDARWILDLDYAPLNRIELTAIGRDGSRQQALTGSEIPMKEHKMPSRSHAAELVLRAGMSYDVLIRVKTDSSRIFPVSFLTPEEFHTTEARQQIINGLLGGIALCLVVYSLTQWINLRDTTFLAYGTSVFFMSTFSLGMFGIISQHVMTDGGWLATRWITIAGVLGVACLAWFSRMALWLRNWNPRLNMLLGALSLCCIFLCAIYSAGIVPRSVAGMLGSVLGFVTMCVSAGASAVRMRAGDHAAKYMLIGWAAYAVGTAIFTMQLGGRVPATYWTQHALQYASVVEMIAWMMVLGVRMEEIRSAARSAHRERESLLSLAHTDSLTGLPNRRGLHDALNGALARLQPAEGSNAVLAVYLLDLDGFKPINDRLGHDAGDELLVQVAQRLKCLLRASDVIARLGGDEFVVVASQLPNEAEARRLGQKLLDGIRTPFDIAGQSCSVGLTIGYALAPTDGMSAADLIKRADAGMYSGKRAGRHCIQRGAEADPACAT